METKKHAVLTDSKGNILGVIGYVTNLQLRNKTFDLIEAVSGNTVKTHLNDVTPEKTFSVEYLNEPSEEFYLTPTTIT